ncbi:hypothetical protein BGW41_007923 [Actinomortierella wolfii]|nr:hypothetical protein BGW41_007923 [Actinomortierella wolfii]
MNQVPAQKRAMLSTSWAKDYLERLTSLPASALHNEPAKLREEQLKVERDMSELAFRDYKAFIHVKDAKDEVHSTLDTLHQHLGQFHQQLPVLGHAISDFSTAVQPILERQHVYSAILACHSQLLDVLEIPLLMETCVRNGYYHEALELSAHVQRLVVRYPGIGLIQGIEAKVAQGKERMLAQLLAQLREPIKLPAALKIVGFLRRMGHFQALSAADDLLLDPPPEKGSAKAQDRKRSKHHLKQQKQQQRTARERRHGEREGDEVAHSRTAASRRGEAYTTSTLGDGGLGFAEPEDETPLKMLFLKSRQAYMQAHLAKIVLYKGDSFGYLKKYIDATRDCLYEIASQYRSIFGGEEHYEFMAGYNPVSASRTVGSTAGSNISHHHASVESYAQKPHCWTTEALLSDFVTDRIQALIQVLDVHIPQIQDTSALSSLLTQLMYCGANLSRIGVDIRYLVTSLFEDAVLRVVGSAFQKATLEFLEGLGGDGRTGPNDWLLPSQWMVTGTTATSSFTTGRMATTGQLSSSSSSSPTMQRSPPLPAPTSPSLATASGSASLTPQTILMDYPSLAYLTNGLLAALNSLRLLAPLSLARPLRMVLKECLLRVEQGLDDYDVAIFGRKNNNDDKGGEGAEAGGEDGKGKASKLDAPQAAAEQRLMDNYVLVYQRAVRDYILKCFDEGIYGGLVLHFDDEEDDEGTEAHEGKDQPEQENSNSDKGEQSAKAEACANDIPDTSDIVREASTEQPDNAESSTLQEPVALST